MEQLQTVVRRCIALGLVWLVVFVNDVGSVSAFIWGNLGVLLLPIDDEARIVGGFYNNRSPLVNHNQQVCPCTVGTGRFVVSGLYAMCLY
jgi:hypothetical protein